MINLLHRLKDNKFLIFFIILAFISIIIISGPKFAYQSFFWQDFKYFEVIHNLSLKKNFLSFLPGAQTINGITITFFEPILNPLSYFNYNLDSVNDYYLYLLILRLLEILVIFVHIKSFQIKITIY